MTEVASVLEQAARCPLLHVTTRDAAARALLEGLLPAGDGRPARHGGVYAPRPGCVYLCDRRRLAGRPLRPGEVALIVDHDRLAPELFCCDEDYAETLRHRHPGRGPGTVAWTDLQASGATCPIAHTELGGTLGDWAHRNKRVLDDPALAAESLLFGAAVAYRAPIPARLLAVHAP